MSLRAQRKIGNSPSNLKIVLAMITVAMISGIDDAQAELQNNRYANPTLEKRKVLGTDGTFRNITAENLLQLPISIYLPFRSKKKLVTPVVTFGNKGSKQFVTTFQPYKSYGGCKSFTRKWRSRMYKIVKYKAKVTLHGFCIETRGGRKTGVVKAVF